MFHNSHIVYYFQKNLVSLNTKTKKWKCANTSKLEIGTLTDVILYYQLKFFIEQSKVFHCPSIIPIKET